MATYKQIFGKTIKSLTTDPTDDGAEGQIWYNDTSDTFKSVLVGGAWSSLAPINTARYGSGMGGTSSAAFLVSGGPAPKVMTEEFNGTGWSSGEDVSVDSYHGGGAGTLTAGLYSCGEYPPGGNTDRTIEYDGTNWTTVTAYPQALKMLASCGTQTDALYSTGVLQPPAGAKQTETREYNGSAWISGGAYPTGLQGGRMAGASSTSAVFVGGSTISPSLSANTYNGTAWAAAPDANSAQQSCGSSGIETSAIFFGGGPGYLTATQSFDGSTWTTESALGTGTADLPTGQMTASNSNAFKVGGAHGPGVTTGVEEYNKAATITTAAAWASSGSLPGPRYGNTGCGTQTAAICVGGGDPDMTTVDKYDGTAWTNTTGLPAARRNMFCYGTQTATGAGQGLSPSTTDTYFEFNGSAWSAEEAVPYSAFGSAGLGTTSAGLVAGGSGPGAVTTCAEYGGEAWTTGGVTNTARWYITGNSGTQTAGLIFGGDAPPVTASTELYNGTAWTAGGSLFTALRGVFASTSGTQTATLSAGGSVDPPASNQSSEYDGTVWSTMPSLATAREIGAGAGTASTGLVAGGLTPGPISDATEEFATATTALNYKTITTS